jgi:hypothetical protein
LGVEISKKLKGKCFWSFGSNRSRGVGICLAKALDYNITNFEFDLDGRWIVLDLLINKTLIRLINVYAPNKESDRNTFFDNVCVRSNVLLGGDFNCIINSNLDKLGGNPDKGMVGSYKLKEICTELNLIDSFIICDRKIYFLNFDLNEWVNFKIELKEIVIAYSKFRKKLYYYDKRELERKYKKITLAETVNPGNYLDQINEVKTLLLQLENQRFKGSVIRS